MKTKSRMVVCQGLVSGRDEVLLSNGAFSFARCSTGGDLSHTSAYTVNGTELYIEKWLAVNSIVYMCLP